MRFDVELTRFQHINEVVGSKATWKSFPKDTQKNRSLSDGVNDIKATISTFNSQLEVSNYNDNKSPIEDISDLTKNSRHKASIQINANDYKKRLDDFQVSLDLAEPDFVKNTHFKAEFPISKFIKARKGNLKHTTIDDFWQSTNPTNIDEKYSLSGFGNKDKTAMGTTKAAPTMAPQGKASLSSKKVTPTDLEENKNEENTEQKNEIRRNFVSSSFDWDEDYGNYDYTRGTYRDDDDNYNYYDYEYGTSNGPQSKADHLGKKMNKVEEDLLKIEEFDSIFDGVPKNGKKIDGNEDSSIKAKKNSGESSHMSGDNMMDLRLSKEKEYENGLRVWKVNKETNNQKSDFSSFHSAAFNQNDNMFNMDTKNKFFLTPETNSNNFEKDNGSGFMRQRPSRKTQMGSGTQKSFKHFDSEMEDYFSKSSGLGKVQEAFQNLKHSMSFESKKVQKKQAENQNSFMATNVESESPIEKLKSIVEEKNYDLPMQNLRNSKRKTSQSVEKRYLRSEAYSHEPHDEGKLEKDQWVPKYSSFADVINSGSQTDDAGSSETIKSKKRKYPLVKHTTYADYYESDSPSVFSRKTNSWTSSDGFMESQPKLDIDDRQKDRKIKKSNVNFYEPMEEFDPVEPKSAKEFARKSNSLSNGFMNNLPSFGIDDGLGGTEIEENEFDYYDPIDEYETEPTNFPRFGDFMKLNSRDAGKVSSFMEDFLKISPNTQNKNSVPDVQVFSTIHPNMNLEQQMTKPSKFPGKYEGTTRPSQKPLPRPDPLQPGPTPTLNLQFEQNFASLQSEENKFENDDTKTIGVHVKSEVKHPPPSWKDLAVNKKKKNNPFASLRKEVKSILNKNKKAPPLLPKLPPVPSPTPPTKREIWRHQFKQKNPQNFGSNIEEVEAPNLWPKSTPVTSNKKLSPFEKGFPPKNDNSFNQFKEIEQPSINDAKQNEDKDFTVPTPTFQTQLAQFAPDTEFFKLPSNFPKNSLNVQMNTDSKLEPPNNDLTNHLLSQRPRNSAPNFQQKIKQNLKREKQKKLQRRPGFSLPILKRPKPTKMNPHKRQPNKIRLKNKQPAPNKGPKSSHKQNSKKRPFKLKLPKMPGFPKLPKLPPMPTMPSLSKEKGKRPKGYKAYGAAPTGFINFADLNIPLVPELPSLPSLDEMQDALFNSPSIADKAVQGYSGLLEDVMSTFDVSSNRRSSDIGSHNEMLQFVPMSSESSYTIKRIPDEERNMHANERMDENSNTQEVNRRGKPALVSTVKEKEQIIEKRTIQLNPNMSNIVSTKVEESVVPAGYNKLENDNVQTDEFQKESMTDIPTNKSDDQKLKRIVSLIRERIVEEKNEPPKEQENLAETVIKTIPSNATGRKVKTENSVSRDRVSIQGKSSRNIAKGEPPKHVQQKLDLQNQSKTSGTRADQRNKSLPNNRLSFNYNAHLTSKYLPIKDNDNRKTKNGGKKFGKFSKLPKNFGYKKWGLRLPSKMLPVARISKRRPRKSEIDLSKKASQERYKSFLKRKFKLEEGKKNRIKSQPNSKQNLKPMQKIVGNPTTDNNFDAISKGRKGDGSNLSITGDTESFESLPLPKKLVMEEKEESELSFGQSNDDLPKPEWSEFSRNSKKDLVMNQNQFRSNESSSSSQLSVKERLENLLSKNILSPNH